MLTVDELSKISNIIIIQTLSIGMLNLIVPFLFRRYSNYKHATMLIVAVIYFANVLNLGYFYLNGGRVVLEIMNIGESFSIKLYLEGIGLIFLTMLSFLWIVAIMYSFPYMGSHDIQNQPVFLFFMSLCIMSASMIALSANLITLFIFYEILTLATMPLVAYGGSEHARRSLKKYFFTLASSSILLLLPAILITHHITGINDFIAHGILSGYLNEKSAIILLCMFIFGCAKAAPIFVHTWLPTAMVASYPVSALLHAVAVVKAGLFTIFKILVFIFGLEYLRSLHLNKIIIYIPVCTIIYSSIVAMRQETVKKMLAYSTISQLSMALLGAFLFTTKGIVAAIFHMVSHSLSKITIFYAAGSIFTSTNKNRIDEMRGIYNLMPFTFHLLLIGSLSLLGIPPLAGFISKYYLLYSATQPENYLIIAILLVGTIFTALYLFRLIYIGYLPLNDFDIKLNPIPVGMKAAPAITAFASLSFIVITKYIMRFTEYIY